MHGTTIDRRAIRFEYIVKSIYKPSVFLILARHYAWSCHLCAKARMSITEGAPAHGQPAHLLPMTYKSMVSAWLEEDTPGFDYGGFVVGEDPAEAHLLAKSPVSASAPFPSLLPHHIIIIFFFFFVDH